MDGAEWPPSLWPGRQLCGLLLLQVKQALGLKGLFLRGPKPGSLDSHAAGRPLPRPSVSQRLLRRTASAPTKSQKPAHKAFPELVLGTQDMGSEGEARDVAPPSPGPAPEALAGEEPGSRTPRGKAPAEKRPAQGQPLRAPEGPRPAGMAATCMKCVVGSCAGEDAEALRMGRPPSPGPAGGHAAISQQPRARADSLGAPHTAVGRSRGAPRGPRAQRQGLGGSGSVSSDSSTPGSPEVAPCWPEGARRQAGALQREMNALFVQKLEEIRSKSPMFSTGKTRSSSLAFPRCPRRGPVGMAWARRPRCLRFHVHTAHHPVCSCICLAPLACSAGPAALASPAEHGCHLGLLFSAAPLHLPGAQAERAGLAAAALTLEPRPHRGDEEASLVSGPDGQAMPAEAAAPSVASRNWPPCPSQASFLGLTSCSRHPSWDLGAASSPPQPPSRARLLRSRHSGP